VILAFFHRLDLLQKGRAVLTGAALTHERIALSTVAPKGLRPFTIANGNSLTVRAGKGIRLPDSSVGVGNAKPTTSESHSSIVEVEIGDHRQYVSRGLGA
jgi:hypothetical protein